MQTHGSGVLHLPELSKDMDNFGGEHVDLVGPQHPAPKIPVPQSTPMVLRGFSAQNHVSGFAEGAQHHAEGMGSHLGAHLTDFVQQPLRESERHLSRSSKPKMRATVKNRNQRNLSLATLSTLPNVYRNLMFISLKLWNTIQHPLMRKFIDYKTSMTTH